MVIKAILGHHKKTDGTRQVKIYIYSDGKKDLIPTEYYVNVNEWENGKVKKSRPNADYINSQLNIRIAELEKTWLNNKGATPAELRKGEITLFGYIDQLIADMNAGKILNKGQRFSVNTIKSYVTYTRYLKNFNPKLNWADISAAFYDTYIGHLRTMYGENTIAKAVKVLKSIMKRGSKFHSNNEYLNFSATYTDVESIALSETEIESIMKARLPEHLQAERDRFYLSYNLLLRFGDSITISRQDLSLKNKKHFVTMIHEKTKNKVIIPLFDKSLEILKKYDYSLPKTTNQESNWKLKEIGKLAGIGELVTITSLKKGKSSKDSFPKHHFITTHTARRSMATNLYLAGFDLKEIQLMGGWKSMAVLEKYLKIDKLQNALKASEHPFFNS